MKIGKKWGLFFRLLRAFHGGAIVFILSNVSICQATTIDLNLFSRRAQLHLLQVLDAGSLEKTNLCNGRLFFQERIAQKGKANGIGKVVDHSGIFYLVPMFETLPMGENLFLSYAMFYDGSTRVGIAQYDGNSIVFMNLLVFDLDINPIFTPDQRQHFKEEMEAAFADINIFDLDDDGEKPHMVLSFDPHQSLASNEARFGNLVRLLDWLAKHQDSWVVHSLKIAPLHGLPSRYNGNAIELPLGTIPTLMDQYRSQGALNILKLFNLPLHPDLEDLSCDAALITQ